MSNKKAQLEITGNATGIERTFDKVKQGGREMAKSVTQSGQEAAKGLDGIGDGAEKGAGKVDKATGSIIASIQRANAVAEAGAKGTAKYYEALANMRGADMAAIKPHLDAMRAIEAAQGNVGISAKQTAAAMRGVPAQFTDIITSLQGGQAPLTVFLQQGGQLKDMFGGAGNAARALGGYVMGLVNPFTVAAAAVGTAALAAYQGSQEWGKYGMALALSGNSAGVSAGQLAAMATAMAATKGTVGANAEALAAMAQQAMVGRDKLQSFTEGAMGMSKATGKSVGDVAKAFAELAKDPYAATLKLNEGMNYLNIGTLQVIKTLQDQGRYAEAAAVAQRAYADAGTTLGKTYENSLGTLERGWNNVASAAKTVWDVLKGLGREAEPEGQLKAVQATIQAVREKIKENPAGAFTPALESELKKLQERESIIQSTLREQRKSLELQAQQAQQVAAEAKWGDIVNLGLDDQKKKRQEIEKIRATGLAARKSEKEIADQIAAVELRYAQKNLGGENEVAAIRAKIEASKDYIARLKDLNIESPKLTEAESQALKIQKELQGAITGVARAQKEKALAAAQELVAQEKLVVTTELWRTAVIKAREEAEKNLQSVFDSAAAIDKQAQSQEAANAVFGKGATAIQQMTLKQLQLDRVLEMDSVGDESNRFIKAIDRKIDAQQRFVNSLLAADYKTLNAGLDEWLRTSQEAGKLYADEARLASLTSLERAKVVAQRQVELQLATKLKDIDQSGLGEADKETLRQKARDAAAVASATATAKAVQDEWTKVADQINQSLTDALMRGFESGKGFAENLRDTIKNMFNTLVLRPIVQMVAGGLTGFGSGNAGASAGGGGTGVMGAANSLSQIKNIFTTGSSALAIGGQFWAGTMSSANAAGTMGANMTGTGLDGLLASNGAFGTAGTTATTIGSAATMMGSALVGFMAGKMISGGYSAIGKSGNTATAAGTAIGMAVGGPIGAIIGGALGGTFNRAFGLKAPQITGEGIQGTFSTAGADVQSYQSWLQKGGWFRSNRSGVNLTAVSGEVDGALDKALIGVSNATKMYAQYIGLSTAAVEGYSKRISISLAGLDAVAQEKAIGDAIATFGTDLAATLMRGSSFTAKEGETVSQTLERLGTSLANVNLVFTSLGQTLLATSVRGADAASKLLDVFGGLENFQQATGAFYEAFYTKAERDAQTALALTTSLGALGLAMPDTIKGYRDLVTAQDLNTDAGRATYAALLQLSPAFKQVADAAAQSAQELAAKQQAIAQQRQGLQDQLDQLLGNTAALRERERTALDESNRALFDQIQALKDQQTAAQAAAQAEKQRQDAIKSASATVLEEARRLRGQTTETASAAFLQSQFAILTGQARAGDTEALGKLPQVTRALEAATRTSARSELDFERIRASLATSLDATLLTLGQPASLSESGQLAATPVVSFAALPESSGASVDAQKSLIDEVRALRGEVNALLVTAQATAVSADKTARTFDLVTQGTGTVLVTTV